MDRQGLDLSCSPNAWFKSNDLPIRETVEPEALMRKLFEITGFDGSKAEYVFKPSVSGGFFMMSLHLKSSHYIGYGPKQSLFGLSTLAHEIGHSTAQKKSTLDHEFLEFPGSLEDGLLVSNENESYLYERVFMTHIKSLLYREDDNEIDWLGLLRKRKAIQNNLHTLKNRMNWEFFSGKPLSEIATSFTERILQIFPDHQSTSNLEWISYATLAEPISRVGYLKAYEKIFAGQ